MKARLFASPRHGPLEIYPFYLTRRYRMPSGCSCQPSSSRPARQERETQPVRIGTPGGSSPLPPNSLPLHPSVIKSMGVAVTPSSSHQRERKTALPPPPKSSQSKNQRMATMEEEDVRVTSIVERDDNNNNNNNKSSSFRNELRLLVLDAPARRSSPIGYPPQQPSLQESLVVEG